MTVTVFALALALAVTARSVYDFASCYYGHGWSVILAGILAPALISVAYHIGTTL